MTTALHPPHGIDVVNRSIPTFYAHWIRTGAYTQRKREGGKQTKTERKRERQRHRQRERKVETQT